MMFSGKKLFRLSRSLYTTKLFHQSSRCERCNLLRRKTSKKTISSNEQRDCWTSATLDDKYKMQIFQNSRERELTENTSSQLQISRPVDKDYLSIDELVSILRDNSCEDLCVIKVDVSRVQFHYVDYFIVVSGRSVRHLKSMANSLCAKFKEKVRERRGNSTAVVEGEHCNDWMVVDIGNIVVHFMMPETREIYELEKLWTLGPYFDDQLVEMANLPDESEMLLPFKSKFASGKQLSKGMKRD